MAHAAAVLLPVEALGRVAHALVLPIQALWAIWWWSLKRHVCDVYFLPRESAGPAPYAWLADERPARRRLEPDAYGRWRFNA
jgi:hypothetical protein